LTSELGYDLRAADAERVRRIISRDDQQFLVAEVDGRPVAWVHAAISEWVESERFAVVGGLVVDKTHRRHGIARMLMEHVEAWAVQQECFIIRLSSSSTRTGAHRFYEQLGYKNVKTQYAFAKALKSGGEKFLNRFVPRVDE
jgi:GNAT superfamily N-acetyltransferase